MPAIQSRIGVFRWRRVAGIAITLLCVAVTSCFLVAINTALGDASMASGWTLLAATLGLYALGWRKKQFARALGPVAAWFQVHVYLGVFALIVFGLHVGWPITGRFESVLAFLFLFISSTGGLLLWYSRRVPKQLAAVKRDFRLEDIPQVQRGLAERAHEIVLRCAQSAAGGPITEFYQRRLLRFFISPRSWSYRCIPTGARRRKLLRELEDLDRYLDSETLEYRRSLSQLVIAKDDTDFHAALQKRLRALMTAHVALTWTLLLLIALHVVLVLRFSGAMV